MSNEPVCESCPIWRAATIGRKEVDDIWGHPTAKNLAIPSPRSEAAAQLTSRFDGVAGRNAKFAIVYSITGQDDAATGRGFGEAWRYVLPAIKASRTNLSDYAFIPVESIYKQKP